MHGRTPDHHYYLSLGQDFMQVREWSAKRPEPEQTLYLFHGFTGSGLDFMPLASFLPPSWRLIAADLPGHGQSRALESDLRFNREHTNCISLRILDRLGIETVSLLGYSMGGRLALHLYFDQPERFTSIALIGATPGIDDEKERSQRRVSDQRIARRLLLEPIGPFMEWWKNRPAMQTQRNLPEPARSNGWLRGRRNRATGLRQALLAWNPGQLPSLWPRLHEIRVPNLWITGQNDTRYSAIAERACERTPDAVTATVEECGHSPHIENPAATAKILDWFLTDKG